MNHLSAVFLIYYQPSHQLSIDEMMIGTQFQISFLQYMPKKTIRFGIKVWIIAEVRTAYVLDFTIYTVATESTDGKKTSLGQKVVLKLMEQY